MGYNNHMNTNNHSEVYNAKAANYSALMCDAAIMDCHDTLRVGEYPIGHPYALQLWAEIDAMRDRKLALAKQ